MKCDQGHSYTQRQRDISNRDFLHTNIIIIKINGYHLVVLTSIFIQPKLLDYFYDLKNQLKKDLLIYKRPSVVVGLAKQISITKSTYTSKSCSDCFFKATKTQ